MSGEKAIAEFDTCGAGQDAECCIFLIGGPKGAECARFTPLHNTLAFRKMAAQRHPVEPFPECQRETVKEPAS